MRVGILGSGLTGGKLGTLFARAGHQVVFSYVRSKEKLKKLWNSCFGFESFSLFRSAGLLSMFGFRILLSASSR